MPIIYLSAHRFVFGRGKADLPVGRCHSECVTGVYGWIVGSDFATPRPRPYNFIRWLFLLRISRVVFRRGPLRRFGGVSCRFRRDKSYTAACASGRFFDYKATPKAFCVRDLRLLFATFPYVNGRYRTNR